MFNEQIELTLENGFIIFDENEKIEVPDYYYEDETTIYQIKELLRSQIKSLPKDAFFKINKNINKRIIECKDDELIIKSDKFNILINIPENKNLIPDKIKTGMTINENKLNNIFILELFESFKKQQQILINNAIKQIENFNTTMHGMLNVFNMISTNNEGYEGDLENGIPNGYGKRFRHRKFLEFEYITIYEGLWNNGHFHGFGKLISFEPKNFNIDLMELNDISNYYEGNFIMDKRHGYGVYFDSEIGTLEGEYIDNDIIGFAKMKYFNGDIYEGGWDMECKQGKGKIIYANGEIFEGEWIDDELCD